MKKISGKPKAAQLFIMCICIIMAATVFISEDFILTGQAAEWLILGLLIVAAIIGISFYVSAEGKLKKVLLFILIYMVLNPAVIQLALHMKCKEYLDIWHVYGLSLAAPAGRFMGLCVCKIQKHISYKREASGRKGE